jgi:regulator of protease activity HflC (stomatin/prohibitin superfamily)
MLQLREAEAEKIRLEIEAEGRAELKSAENAARALHRLGQSYKDNQAVLQYELAGKKLEVAQTLLRNAPRPVIVNQSGGGEQNSALATLLLAQILPDTLREANSRVENGDMLPRLGGKNRQVKPASDSSAEV